MTWRTFPRLGRPPRASRSKAGQLVRNWHSGETPTGQWEQALQHFVIASGAGGGPGAQLPPAPARLEHPRPGSLQRGRGGGISGGAWEAARGEIVVENGTPGDPPTVAAGAGPRRTDPADMCRDTDNGLGVLGNWNKLEEGQHPVRALGHDVEVAHRTFTVTTLGAEFVRGLERTQALADFPTSGQTVTVEWQDALQNFTLTARE